MRKTHYRDYATEAFRFLAREGSARKYTDCIRNAAIEEIKRREVAGVCEGIGAPTEDAAGRAEDAVKEAQAEIDDLDAAEWALIALESMRGLAAVNAVKMVYMVEPDIELERGDIANRTAGASIKIPASIPTIYRWLGLARKLFAEKRGLRT